MATNLPSIPTLRSADLRELNGAFNAVRQQFIVLVGIIDQVSQKAGQNALNSGGSTSTLTQIQQQLASLQNNLNALIASGVGPTASYRADAAVALGDPVYPSSDGGVSPVDTQDPTAMFAAIGVATAGAAAGGNVVVRRSGAMTIPEGGLEPGRAVYAQVGSGLTQWPNYAGVALPIGVALTTTTVDVRTAWPAQQDMPLYAGGYEDFLPVTLGLVRAALEIIGTLSGQADGIVVKVGDQLVTREIVSPSGGGINVYDGDGVFGNPQISVE